jgi:hypothetical protein
MDGLSSISSCSFKIDLVPVSGIGALILTQDRTAGALRAREEEKRERERERERERKEKRKGRINLLEQQSTKELADCYEKITDATRHRR